MDRTTALAEILAQDPTNILARYGLAMEYANSGQTDRALEEFRVLLSTNPDYPAAYFMSAPNPGESQSHRRSQENARKRDCGSRAQARFTRRIRDAGNARRPRVKWSALRVRGVAEAAHTQPPSMMKF